MDINLVKEGIVSGVSNAAETIKEAVVWLGRTICEGCSALAEIIANCWNYVSTFVCESAVSIADFTVEHAFPWIKDASITTFSFLRSPAGLAFVGMGAGVGCAFVAEVSDTHVVRSGQVVRENPILATAFRVGAFMSFLAAGISIGYGAVNGFHESVI
jgi:hypothetical protein